MDWVLVFQRVTLVSGSGVILLSILVPGMDRRGEGTVSWVAGVLILVFVIGLVGLLATTVTAAL